MIDGRILQTELHFPPKEKGDLLVEMSFFGSEFQVFAFNCFT